MIAQDESAFLLRVPGLIGSLVWSQLIRRDRPYAVEVVGDPNGVLQPGAIRSFVRVPARWFFVHGLRRQCRGAAAAAYVTRQALQRRYPVGAARPSFYLSDVDLPSSAFASQPKRSDSSVATSLVVVGTLAQMYKGPDVLLKALALAAQRGLDLHAVWVGDGRSRAPMDNLPGHWEFSLESTSSVMLPRVRPYERTWTLRTCCTPLAAGGIAARVARGHGARSALHRLARRGSPGASR